MKMIRATIIAEGDVQKAGYRDIVEDIAVKLGVKGFVENLRDKTVCIVCEGEKDAVDKFVDAIKIKNDIVDVKSVKIVETSPATDAFKYFDIKYGSPEEELGERMVAAVKYAKLALHETRGVSSEVKGSREDIKGVREEVKDSREDIKGVREEVKDSREDIKGVREEVKGSRKDIQDMHKDLVAFKDQTTEHFTDLKGSYHTFSERMLSMEEKLTQLVEYIGMLVKNHIEKEEKGR